MNFIYYIYSLLIYLFTNRNKEGRKMLNQKDINAMSLGYVSGLRNNYLREIKMFIQRCKAIMVSI